MKNIKCLFCGKETSIHKINAQKKVKGKIITVMNAPVYYCTPCNETFLSKEAQDVFRYIQDRNLDERNIMFNYEEISRKLY